MSSPARSETHESTQRAWSEVVGKTEEGLHLAVGGLGEHPQALAELLAERESRGIRVPVVTLLVRTHRDAEAISGAVAWLGSRGRRVVVRTRLALPKLVVQSLDPTTVTVELELAHHKPAIQRALLGSTADSTAALLLQAQYLETLGIPVIARLGPLLPGVHDQGPTGHKIGFDSLLRNVVAADVGRVTLEVGELDSVQLAALTANQRELSAPGLLELAKAYGIDPMVVLGMATMPDDRVWRVKPRRAAALVHGLAQLVAAVGLDLAAAIQASAAANDGQWVASYESVLGRDLFAGLTP